jgi:hypothetical protein
MVTLLFSVVILAIIGGAIWLVAKKNSSSNGTGPIGGGGTIPDEPTGPINEA